jgi:hypothetical protein
LGIRNVRKKRRGEGERGERQGSEREEKAARR